MKPQRLRVVSDIHYAGPEERARADYEARAIGNPLARWLVRGYRRYIWLRDPFAHNHLLDWFIAGCEPGDIVIANGDYSCDSGFVGVADEAACASAVLCLEALRGGPSRRFLATIGDHELGKRSLVGGRGGLRLESWERTVGRLGLRAAWREDLGRTTLVGVCSTLAALPIYGAEGLEEEAAAWRQLRVEHLAELEGIFGSIAGDRRILLFCHDPSALPFLLEIEALRTRLAQLDATVIGHLHSEWILRKTRRLAGVPAVRGLGPSLRRMSSALSRARLWEPFKLRLCPSLAGLEWPQDGGWLSIEVDPSGALPATIELVRTPRALRRGGGALAGRAGAGVSGT